MEDGKLVGAGGESVGWSQVTAVMAATKSRLEARE